MCKTSFSENSRRTRLACWAILAAMLAWSTWTWTTSFVFVGDAAGSTVAHAQGDTPADDPPPEGKKLLSYITDAGWIGGVIILCSLVGFSLAITFAFQHRRDTLVPPEVLGEVERSFEEENYDEAYEICESNPSFFSVILAAGLSKIDLGYDEIEGAMIEAGEVEANKLHQKVGYLSLIAAIWEDWPRRRSTVRSRISGQPGLGQ